MLPGLQPHRLEPELGRARRPADRHEQLVGLDALAPVELDFDGAVPRDRDDIRLETDVDATLAQRLGDLFAHERLLALEQPLPAVDERHPSAERRPRLRQLDADDAAAEHEETRGHLLRGRRLDVRPRLRVAQARDVGDRRRAAGRDDDRPPRAEHVVADARRAVRPSSRPCPRTSVTPRSSSHGSCEESSRSWITSSRRASTAATSERAGRDAGHAPRLGGELDGPQQRLRRHARVEGALAADESLLDDRDLEARLAQAPGDHLAGRPCADHDHVELASSSTAASSSLPEGAV